MFCASLAAIYLNGDFIVGSIKLERVRQRLDDIIFNIVQNFNCSFGAVLASVHTLAIHTGTGDIIFLNHFACSMIWKKCWTLVR